MLNKGITGILLPNSITIIGERAFADNRINHLTLPSGLKSIEYRAFQTNRIQEVIIPDSVDNLGELAFGGNPLRKVFTGNGVTIIPHGAFGWNSEQGLAADGKNTVIIGTNVTEIKQSAFYAAYFTEVVIPQNVRVIGSDAFGYNYSLRSITIGSGVEVYSNSFTSVFSSAYESNGKAAGTYTYNTETGTWSMNE